MKVLYQQNIPLALQKMGVTPTDIQQTLETAQNRINAFVKDVQQDAYPAFNSMLTLPKATQKCMESWPQKFEHIVFLGMGGSSLGARLISHFQDAANLQNPRLHIIDYIDPEAIAALKQKLPLEKTGVIAISKSGGTAETMAQTLLLAEDFQAAGLPLSAHFLTVTEPDNSSPLAHFSKAYSVPTLPHHPKLGGRYSIPGETGTLPALLKGMDVSALHKGMQHVVKTFLENPFTAPAAEGAALHALAEAKGKKNHVMYAYGEKLRVLPAWFEQLWAESLGKKGKGTTPVCAVGPGSQHSIQQLFIDGPKDKLFTLILPKTAHQGPPIMEQDFMKSLTGVTPGTLQQAMGEGTSRVLSAYGHPVRTFQIETLNTEVLGGLLMHFMLETVLTACIWDVDPFNQPAVEDSKWHTLAALSELR